MAIGTPTEKAFVASATDATSYATSAGAWTPTTGNLYVAFVENSKSGTPTLPTFSGNGLTWRQIATVLTSTSSQRQTAFAVEGTGGSSGESTADFGGVTQTGCTISVLEVTGVDVSSVATSPGAGKSIVQAPTGQDAGQGQTFTVTYASAENALNRPLSGFICGFSGDVVPRANWSETSDHNHGTPSAALETQWRSDAFETTSTATVGSNTRWAAIGLELRDASLASSWSVGFIPIF